VVQRRLGQQHQRVGLLLRPGRGLGGRVGRQRGSFVGPALLVEPLAGGVEGPQEQRARLRRQPPPDHHRAVLVLVDVQRPARVLPGGLARFARATHEGVTHGTLSSRKFSVGKGGMVE
jgi:hypothetical protein